VKDQVHVFVNRQKVELPTTELTGAQLLERAGFQGNTWDLLRLQGEGDPTGGTVIQAAQVITVKNGEHFRVLPGNRTFGLTGQLPRELVADAEEFTRITGFPCDLIAQGNRVFVHIKGARLPSGKFRAEQTDVLFQTDMQYRMSAMDMFWVNLDVIHADGRVPQAAETIEHYLGRQWRRYSWHRNGIWNPGRNGILDHYAFVEARWSAQ
jgi:hypothetical protein